MRFLIVRNLITHTWCQRKSPAIFQFRFEFPFNTKDDVALGTPMIREIARCVFDHANTDAAAVLSTPIGGASRAAVCRWFNLRPVSDRKGEARNLHNILSLWRI